MPVGFEAPRIAVVDKYDSGIVSADLEKTVRLDAGKVVHRYVLNIELVEEGTEIPGPTYFNIFHIFKNVATLVKAQATVAVAATGADRQAALWLYHSDQGAAFGFAIATFNFDNTDAARTPKEVTTFTRSAMAAGDVLRLGLAVSGSAGDQAKGMTFSLTCTEIGD